jgi:hypothetical protein
MTRHRPHRDGPTRTLRRRALPLVPLCLALCLPLSLALGCVTREVEQTTFERGGITVLLREHKQGFQVIEQDFQHPAQISVERLVHILGAIDIRGREEELAGVRAAFEPSQLLDIATGLSKGLKNANSNQELAVSIVRKQMQHVIFDRKKLTSFVAYLRDDLLYLHFSRVDWEIPDRVKKTALPEPRVNEHPMKFQVIPVEGMYAEGIYAVSVEWQDPVFRQPLHRVRADDDRRERTILMEEPDRPDRQSRSTLPADLLPYLSPSQLRELADLEEARQEGRMTEGRYRRERERILDEARREAATSR